MKEKDFFGVVSAIAQFIEKADQEPGRGGYHPPENYKNREDEPNHESSK